MSDLLRQLARAAQQQQQQLPQQQQQQPTYYFDYPSSRLRVPQDRMMDSPHYEPPNPPGFQPTPPQAPAYPAAEAFQQWMKTHAGPIPAQPFIASNQAMQEGKDNVPQDVQAMQQGMIYGPGPVRGQLHLLPQYQNLGQIRPFGPGEWINRTKPDGTTGWSSEETTSVQFPNGQFAVVPTLWMVNGQPMTVDAGTAAQYAQQSGLNWPMFKTQSEAEMWADHREKAWQTVPFGGSHMQPPLWSRQFPPPQ